MIDKLYPPIRRKTMPEGLTQIALGFLCVVRQREILMTWVKYFYIGCFDTPSSLKFETIYRIERYVCNPIFLLIIIHRDAIGLL